MVVNSTNPINKNHKYFLIVVFLCSTFYSYGEFAKKVESRYGILLLPTVMIFSYIAFVGKPEIASKTILLGMLAIMLVLISYFRIGGGLGSVFNNIVSIIYILLFFEIKFNRAEYVFFSKLIYLYQVYLILYCLINRYELGYVGIYNANTFGLQILFDLLYIDLYISRKNKWMYGAINVISVLVIFYTRSRIVIAAGIAVILLLLYNRKYLLKKWIIKAGFWTIMFLGIYLPFFYVKLSRNSGDGIVSLLINYSIRYFNKNFFTGREYIWGTAIDQLTQTIANFFLGIGSHYSDQITDGNFHSSYFTIFLCCGLLMYIVFTLLLYQLFIKEDLIHKFVQRSRLLYLAIMLIGITESTLFSGHYAILAYMLLCASDSFDEAGGVE